MCNTGEKYVGNRRLNGWLSECKYACCLLVAFMCIKDCLLSWQEKTKTTEVDWLGKWGSAALALNGHLQSHGDGRILLKGLAVRSSIVVNCN
jgi:hypothetical protein